LVANGMPVQSFLLSAMIVFVTSVVPAFSIPIWRLKASVTFLILVDPCETMPVCVCAIVELTIDALPVG
jgi:hypothetical protein